MFSNVKYKTKKYLIKNFTPLIKKYRRFKISKTYSENYWNNLYQQSLDLARNVEEVPYYDFISKENGSFNDKNSGPGANNDLSNYGCGVLEINNTCNIDCLMCKTSMSKRKKGKMSEDIIDKSLDKFQEDNIKTVALHTIGDPLANPKLKIVLDKMRKRKMFAIITTNGLLLYRHINTLLEYMDVCSQIEISIDGATKKTYEKIRAGGSWKELLDNLNLLNNKLRNKGFRTAIRMVVSKDNYSEIGKHIYLFKNYVDFPYLDLFYSQINSLTPDNSYYNQVNLLTNHSYLRIHCDQVKMASPYILLDGSVSVCCRDYHGDMIIGSIKKNSLKEIRKSSLLKKLQSASK